MLMITASTSPNLPGGALPDRSSPAYLATLSLSTPPSDVRTHFGAPDRASCKSELCIYDYDEFERGEYGWSFVFEVATERMLCITRRFTVPQDLATLFPSTSTTRHESRRGAVASVRRLDPGRILIGISRQQIVLVRASAIARFFPWIASV